MAVFPAPFEDQPIVVRRTFVDYADEPQEPLRRTRSAPAVARFTGSRPRPTRGKPY